MATAPVITTPATAPKASTALKPGAVSEAVADARNARAVQIHRNLKELRKMVEAQIESNGAMKARAGDLRRELRKSVGQLSLDKKANSPVVSSSIDAEMAQPLMLQQTQKVSQVFLEGLDNVPGSTMMDPTNFVFDTSPDQTQPALLPSLFLFLVNQFARFVIKQLVTECSANTKMADPIGVLVVSVFADPKFYWNGRPLIDILIAKFHVVCPVLFGGRGAEETAQGKDRIGWRRNELHKDVYINPSEHYSRQMGLAAGFAAMTLRDYSKSKKASPYPMSHYWEAFAHIVNTGFEELSTTQCIVLKALIEHYEQRILLFYGNAGMAALSLALVHLPANAKASGRSTASVDTLSVLCKTLRQKYGLVLV